MSPLALYGKKPAKLLGVPHAAEAVDEDPQPELWRLVGSKVGQLLEHFETVQPRHEDVDIAHNAVETDRMDSARTLSPNQVFTAVNNTPKVFQFIAKPGWVAHIDGFEVKPLNPTQSMALVAVKVEFSGRTIQKVPALGYRRPVMLDRDDVLTITVSNTSGGDLTLQYALSGWLRSNKEC